MSILKQLLKEMTQSEMHFEDSMEETARKVARELLETAVQITQEMAEDDPDLEMDEAVLIDVAENFFEDLFGDDVKRFIKKEAPKYVR